MKYRDSHLYAFLCGFWERLRLGDAFGRTHDTDQGWNECYDRGANVADWIRLTPVD